LAVKPFNQASNVACWVGGQAFKCSNHTEKQMGKNYPTLMGCFTCNSNNPIFGLLQPKMKPVILTLF